MIYIYIYIYTYIHMSAGIANDRIPKKTFDPNPDGMHETCKKCSCNILGNMQNYFVI